MHKTQLTLSRIALACACVVLTTASFASDRHDHERARKALESGEILPLRAVLERVERDYPGQFLEVELDRDDGRWLYEIKLIHDDGRMEELELDARDGSLVSRKGRKRYDD